MYFLCPMCPMCSMCPMCPMCPMSPMSYVCLCTRFAGQISTQEDYALVGFANYIKEEQFR